MANFFSKSTVAHAKIGHVNITMPLLRVICHPFSKTWYNVPQGRFVVRQLGLAIVNLYTKYEVSMFAHYKDMKGDKKYKNWGGLGG